MKNVHYLEFNSLYSHGIALSVALISVHQLAAAPLESDGWIKVDRQTVVAESVVNIEWSATYPTPLPPKDPSGTVTTTTCTLVEVRAIGAAFGPSNKPYPVRGWVKAGSSSGWEQIFLGNQNTVNPQTVIWQKVLEGGEKLDFEFQGSYDQSYNLSNVNTIGSWQPKINTTPSSPRQYNLLVLKDNDIVPNFNAAFDQDDIHGHLKSYFEPSSKKLKLGPNDYIYLTELSPFNQGHRDTDLQDLVFLVTFTPQPMTVNGGGCGGVTVAETGNGHSNNGHGNNIDGVDSSNPGNGGGGPNGQVDPSGTVDDEGRGGGASPSKNR